MIKVLCAIGTRPEAIKMAPVIHALSQAPWAQVRVLATAQHRQMLDQMLQVFGIFPVGSEKDGRGMGYRDAAHEYGSLASQQRLSR